MALPDVAQGDPHVAAHNSERHAINDILDLSDAGFVEALSGVSGAIARREAARNARAAVCFTWDDGLDEHYTTVLPALSARKQRHTFFINSGTLNTAGFLTSAQLAAIHAAGHEIGAHGVTHTNLSTASMTSASARAAQYDDCKTAIEAIIGAGECTSFAYPFGAHTDSNNRELYLRYKRTAGVGSSSWALPYQRELGQRARDVVRLQWHSSDHAANLARLRAWADRPVIFVFYSHRIPEDLTVAEMVETLDLLDELGIETLRMDEAFGSDELQNGGFEDGMTGWHLFSASAGASHSVETDTPDVGLSGTKSLLMSTAADGDSIVISQRFPVTPGIQYTISGRARASRVPAFNGPTVRTRGVTGEGTTTAASAAGTTTTIANATALGLPSNGAASMPSTWTRFSGTVTPAAGEAWLSVELIISNAQSAVYFDHIDCRPTMWGGMG